VLSRSGSGPRSEAEAARQQPEADHERTLLAAVQLAKAANKTSEEARQQAQAEKLTLLVAENKTGYFGVRLKNPGQPKPYEAQVSRGGSTACLGSFVTAEEAALCIARSPEGRAAAAAAAAPPPPPTTTSEEARQHSSQTDVSPLDAPSVWLQAIGDVKA